MTTMTDRGFDVSAARRRCLTYRRRILEMSQKVAALHVAPAFSCLEVVDVIYNALMRRDRSAENGAAWSRDTFLMSKGHGCLAQYAILEELGVLTREEMERYCTVGGKLGAHPDYGVPGIEASTGSLGHGLGMAMGMALADKTRGDDRVVYVVLSDGELQEGSTWEALMLAPSLGLSRLVAFVDLNDFQSLGRTSETLPNFYPMLDKVLAFGWESAEIDGHDAQAIYDVVTKRRGAKPQMVLAHTVKGKGVSFMENVPIWHYRSPNPEEYRAALAELAEAEPRP
jgi:transketolase